MALPPLNIDLSAFAPPGEPLAPIELDIAPPEAPATLAPPASNPLADPGATAAAVPLVPQPGLAPAAPPSPQPTVSPAVQFAPEPTFSPAAPPASGSAIQPSADPASFPGVPATPELELATPPAEPAAPLASATASLGDEDEDDIELLRPPPKPFPRAQAGELGAALWDYAKSQRPPVKVALAALAAVAVTLVGLLLWAAFSPQVHPAYVAEATPLCTIQEQDCQGDKLVRGNRVDVFAEMGAFALVRDMLGRAGYVRMKALQQSAPPSVLGLPFVDCQRAAFDPNGTLCQERGNEQLELCNDACGKAVDEENCRGDCRKLHFECRAICGGQLKPAAPAAQAADEPQPAAEPAAEAAPEPAADAESSAPAADKPEPKAAPVKPEPKKKARRHKRRRR